MENKFTAKTLEGFEFFGNFEQPNTPQYFDSDAGFRWWK